MYRQGDILLIPVQSADCPTHCDQPTLALGEATGHAHRLDVEARVSVPLGELVEFAAGNRPLDATPIYLAVDNTEAYLRHEEHAPIHIAPGLYEVRRQREYDDLDRVRQVAD